MIYRYRLTSDERPDFVREYEADAANTLFDLHHCIQKDLGYDDSQHVSMAATNAAWQAQEQFTMFGGSEAELMDQTPLRRLVRAHYHRMIYTFDLHNGRFFKLELQSMDEPEPRAIYPRPVAGRGEPPVQVGGGKHRLSDDSYHDAMPDVDVSMYGGHDEE